MNHSRPINLNLFTIHFPLPAIVSILHRISGFFLFLMIPILLWALDFSLTAQGYDTIQNWLGHIYVQILVWLFLVPFSFHFVAGIRHLLMDVHVGDRLKAGRVMSVLTFLVTLILLILAGIWLW